jgi:hypothetical protein
MIGGGAVSGAEHDGTVRGNRTAAASSGKGDERPNPPDGKPQTTLHGRSGEGRISPSDGTNRPRIRMPGAKD